MAWLDFTLLVIFVHVVGDYMLQGKSMMIQKSSNSMICALHVTMLLFLLIVPAASAVYAGAPRWAAWTWIAISIVTHFIIDRYQLAARWLRFVGGRSFYAYFRDGAKTKDGMKYCILDGGFTALTYAVVDNTWHLAVMLGCARWLLF